MSESILIVDDLPENRRLYSLILQDLGCAIVEAANGTQAIERAQEADHAMILLDVHLPDIDGFAVAREIRQLQGCAATPIVFVSAIYNREADIFHGYDMGAVDYLLAPVIPAVLRAKASVFLRLRQLRREAEAQATALAAANLALQESYLEMEAFSYAAAHDLRSPLHGMELSARILIEDYGDRLDDEGRDYLERMATSATNLHNLVADLLKLAQLNRHALARQPCDLSSLAAELAFHLGADHRPAPSWDIAAGLAAEADPVLLRAVLANLFDNAVKYSAKVAAPAIAFGAELCDGETVYYVRDNGVGFDARAPGLFKAFHRLHAASEFPGTGVGLSTARRIVERHGGRIWAESAPGAGAIFHFTLAERRGGATA